MAWDPIRKWMTRRPLMLFAACLTGGMTIGVQNAVPWPFWAIGLAVCAALGIVRKRGVFVFSAALMLGALLTTLALIRPPVAEANDITLQGRIASEPTVTDEYTRFTLTDASQSGQALSTDVLLYVYGDQLPPLEYGMTISSTANLYLPADRENPYADRYSDYLWRQGVALCGSASARDLTIVSPAGRSLSVLSIRCRIFLQSIVNEVYSEETAPLISALTLGDRSMLPDELYENFRTAGLAHLLAISGLHISCLAVALDQLLRRLYCPDKASFILTTLFLLAYASVIGFPASISRAILMYVLSAGARLFGRPSDGLTGLSLALIILLLINPLNIADISLILSFSSVAGIMMLTRTLTPRRLCRLPGPFSTAACWLFTALAASLAAQLGSLPTIACVFGSLSTYSLLANLPALPLMTLALPMALLSVGAGCLSPLLGRIVAFPVEWALRLLVRLTQLVAALPCAAVNTPMWSAALLLLYALILIFCSPVSYIRRRFKQGMILLLPMLAASALLLPMTFPTAGLEVLFLNVGQADAAVIRAEDQYYLMDVGQDSTMADYLHSSGIRPKAIFLSHPHADHAGGLEEILELCEPAVLYLPVLWNEVTADRGVPELIEQASAAGWVIQYLTAGDSLRLSDHVNAAVHQPFPNMTDEANGSSLVMSVHLGQSSLLFTGDLTIADEYAVFPDCDVIKVAHHGAETSTSGLFLQMTTPSAAILSVGHNAYGHPAPETLGRLTASGTVVYRTDQCGAVSVLMGADGTLEITPINLPTQPEAHS